MESASCSWCRKRLDKTNRSTCSVCPKYCHKCCSTGSRCNYCENFRLVNMHCQMCKGTVSSPRSATQQYHECVGCDWIYHAACVVHPGHWTCINEECRQKNRDPVNPVSNHPANVRALRIGSISVYGFLEEIDTIRQYTVGYKMDICGIFEFEKEVKEGGKKLSTSDLDLPHVIVNYNVMRFSSSVLIAWRKSLKIARAPQMLATRTQSPGLSAINFIFWERANLLKLSALFVRTSLEKSIEVTRGLTTSLRELTQQLVVVPQLPLDFDDKEIPEHQRRIIDMNVLTGSLAPTIVRHRRDRPQCLLFETEVFPDRTSEVDLSAYYKSKLDKLPRHRRKAPTDQNKTKFNLDLLTRSRSSTELQENFQDMLGDVCLEFNAPDTTEIEKYTRLSINENVSCLIKDTADICRIRPEQSSISDILVISFRGNWSINIGFLRSEEELGVAEPLANDLELLTDKKSIILSEFKIVQSTVKQIHKESSVRVYMSRPLEALAEKISPGPYMRYEVDMGDLTRSVDKQAHAAKAQAHAFQTQADAAKAQAHAFQTQADAAKTNAESVAKLVKSSQELVRIIQQMQPPHKSQRLSPRENEPGADTAECPQCGKTFTKRGIKTHITKKHARSVSS